MAKYYVVQYGYAMFGEGQSESEAIADARANDCDFDMVLHITGARASGSCRALMTEAGELLDGQIVVMDEQQYQDYCHDE